MIDLSAFSDLANMDLGAMRDKPTALKLGQKEASTTLWSSDDGRIHIGVWECSPGQFTADRTENAEFCYILAGKAIMTHRDGKKKELTPGDALMLPHGWKGVWDIAEHVRKIYVTYR